MRQQQEDDSINVHVVCGSRLHLERTRKADKKPRKNPKPKHHDPRHDLGRKIYSYLENHQ